jgi:hypothetical protein
MKVKLFINGFLDRLQHDINEWLSSNTVDIKHIKQSDSKRVVISIWYEDRSGEG